MISRIARLRRSLAVKWLFTLLFTGLFGVGLVWFFANRTTNTGFDQLKIDQAQSEFETTVTNYYVAHGSWDGILDTLEPKQAPVRGGAAIWPLSAEHRTVGGRGRYHRS